MISDDLYQRIYTEYHTQRQRELCIEVSEDGECGSECHYVI